MSEAERLHYSSNHWEKHFNDCLAGSQVYEARVRRGEICSPERAAEVMASARDRIFHAYVNGCKMFNDPLRIAGISFGVMLDDAKRKLRQEIDAKFKTERFAKKFEWLIDDYLTLISERPQPKHAPGGPGLPPRGRMYIRDGGRRFGKTAEQSAIVERLEKGEDVMDYYDAIAQYRKDHGYYDPWYLKAWKKFKRWDIPKRHALPVVVVGCLLIYLLLYLIFRT